MVQPIYRYREIPVFIVYLQFYYKMNLCIHIKIFNLISPLPILSFAEKYSLFFSVSRYRISLSWTSCTLDT